MVKYLVECGLTQDVLGIFKDRSEAEAFAATCVDSVRVVVVSNDPDLKAAWESYYAAIENGAQQAEQAAREALSQFSIPEGWRLIVDGYNVSVQQLRWVSLPPESFSFAHGEDFGPCGEERWVHARKDEMPEEVREAYEAACAAGATVPDPKAPEAIYAPEFFEEDNSEAWSAAAAGYWLLADGARQRRLWREMRRAASAAKEAEMKASMRSAAGLGREAQEAAELGRGKGALADSARQRVLAEMERHKARGARRTMRQRHARPEHY